MPTQLDPRSNFGQPPLTVWRNESFVVDLYFWVDTEIRRPDQKTGFRDRYADTLMESILLHLQPAMEQASGLRLFPTYSYLRIYETGAVLTRHKDRRACEISASLTLGYDAAEAWPLWLETRQQQRSILLQPGDMLVYKGREVPHWRDRFDGNYWIQAFFHYVDADGPLAAYKFDRRSGIGVRDREVKS